jgi:hypothetical protein
MAKKPARIHVQMAVVAGVLRGAQAAIRDEGFRFGRGEEYLRGAEDGLNEFLQRARQCWGEEFVRQWELTRVPVQGSTP